MLLVMLTSEKVNGEYKIEDVVIVLSEMKERFKMKRLIFVRANSTRIGVLDEFMDDEQSK